MDKLSLSYFFSSQNAPVHFSAPAVNQLKMRMKGVLTSSNHDCDVTCMTAPSRQHHNSGVLTAGFGMNISQNNIRPGYHIITNFRSHGYTGNGPIQKYASCKGTCSDKTGPLEKQCKTMNFEIENGNLTSFDQADVMCAHEFHSADTNKDGVLHPHEHAAAYHHTSHAALDTNKDGKLTLGEAVHGVQEMYSCNNPNHLCLGDASGVMTQEQCNDRIVAGTCDKMYSCNTASGTCARTADGTQSQADCNSTCTVPEMYSCNNPNHLCLGDASGVMTQEQCNVRVDAGTCGNMYSCNTASGTCTYSVDGTQLQADCESSCTSSQHYSCNATKGICYIDSASTQTQADCESSCTPPTPTTCDSCLGANMQWCWTTNTCMPVASGCTYDAAVCNNTGLCKCTSCSDTGCEPSACTAQVAADLDEFNAPYGFVGKKDLTDGDGCAVANAWVKACDGDESCAYQCPVALTSAFNEGGLNPFAQSLDGYGRGVYQIGSAGYSSLDQGFHGAQCAGDMGGGKDAKNNNADGCDAYDIDLNTAYTQTITTGPLSAGAGDGPPGSNWLTSGHGYWSCCHVGGGNSTCIDGSTAAGQPSHPDGKTTLGFGRALLNDAFDPAKAVELCSAAAPTVDFSAYNTTPDSWDTGGTFADDSPWRCGSSSPATPNSCSGTNGAACGCGGGCVAAGGCDKCCAGSDAACETAVGPGSKCYAC